MSEIDKEALKNFPRKKSKKDSISKFLSDFLPLIVFVVVYKTSNSSQPLVPATLWMIIVTFVALVISYILTKKIAKMPLIAALTLGIFGGITVFSGDDYFIKIKPTLINCIFASILFFGYFTKKPLISYLFGGELKMKGDAWHIMSFRWGCFFLFLALLNEIVWRNFSVDFWVDFKVFGILPITMVFMITQMPFIIKNVQKD